MKLILVTNDGTVIDDIEDVEEFDLDKPMARAELISEIKRMVELAHGRPQKETYGRGKKE